MKTIQLIIQAVILNALLISITTSGMAQQMVEDKLRLVYNEKQAVAKQVGTTVSNDGKLVAFAYDNGTIKIVDLTFGRATKTLKTDLRDLFELRFNYDGSKLILAANNRRVEVHEIQSGKVTYRFELPKDLNRVAVSRTKDYVAFGVDKSRVHIYDLAANKEIQKLDVGGHHISGLDFHPNGKHIAATAVKTFIGSVPIKIFDIQSGKEIDTVDGKNLTEVFYSNDGSKLIGITLAIKEFNFKIYDLKTRSLKNVTADRTGLGNAPVISSAEYHDGKLLVSSIDQTFSVLDLNTGQRVYTTLRDGNFRLSQNGRKLGIDAKRIYPLYDGKSFLINYADNNINQIYNVEANAISAYLYSDANDDFAVVARDGRMEGNAEAIANVAWSQRGSDKRVPLEATFDQYYTPNLLQVLLSDESGSQDIATLEKTIELSPLVEIIQPDSVFSTNKDQLTLTVKGTPQGDPIQEIKVYVNGKPLSGIQRGLKMSGTTKTATVPLLPGRSVISAVAISDGGYQSGADRIVVDYQGRSAEANLHVLAVGIDKYYNPNYNLNYATADASAFTEELKQKADGIFADINITYIKDGEATKENIQRAITSIQDKARMQDVFIFYYAGHGVMTEGSGNNAGDFYLALHDVTQLYGRDQMLKEKGISAAEMRDIFSGIQAQKQLIVLDACQSGGAVETFAMRGAAEEKAMIQLARSSGVVLLASTGSEQFATEFEELGHGLFTYSILQGLDGQADSGDNKVTVKELEVYLNDSVPELAQKYKGTIQFPRSWSRGMDFPIGVIK